MSAPITSARIKFETLARHISSTASSANSFKPESEQCIIASARNEIFTLGSVVGRMCSAFLTVSHDGSGDGAVGDDVAMILGEVFIQLFVVSNVCGIDLRMSVLKKMELNGRKYPVELCKVRLYCN